MSDPTVPVDTGDALAPGTMLLWYRVERVLGRGGFAITYLATDTHLEQAVAVKEYLPLSLGFRGATGVHANPGHEAHFAWGRERFLDEARTLARFKHRHIVRVLSFFEAGNTAYLVMDFEAGENLSQFLARHPGPDAATLMAIVRPVMDGLEHLHRAGFIHRDIKPANIYLRRDGSPVLIDFGAARQALGGQTQNLTSLLSPGYAPLEQYFSEKDRQGPWSDIYALAAVMYQAISGSRPPEASLRSSALINGAPDPLLPARQAGLGRYPDYLLRAVDQGLRLRERERPRSLAEWRERFEPPTLVPELVVPLEVSALNFDSPPRPPADPAPPMTPANPPPAIAPAEPSAAVVLAPPALDPPALAPPLADPETAAGGPAPSTRALASDPSSVAEAAPVAATRSPPAARPIPSGWSSRDPGEAGAPRPRRRAWPFLAGLLVAGAIVWLLAGRHSEPVVRPPPPVRPDSPPAAPATPAPAPAERPLEAGDARSLADGRFQACRAEADALCAGVRPGDGRLAACIRDNLQHLPEDCRPLLRQRLQPRPPRPEREGR